MREIKVKIPEPEDVIPERALKHFVNAYREFLLGIRELIDSAIEVAERKKEGKEVKKIEVE